MAHRVGRRSALSGTIAAGFAWAGSRPALAQRSRVVRIGVLTELSGPNSVATGQGSILATKMAVEDFKRANPDLSVEVVDADHQTKPDLAVSIAREWLDRADVDCITSLNNSAVALAVVGLVRERDRVALLTGPASSDLTGKACSQNHVHWTYDTWSLGNGTGRALVAEGGDTWFFIAADYTFGRLLAGDTARFVTAAGGRVLGTAYTPYPETTDFSSFLLRAQASGAKVIGLANSGTNTINCVKQAAEFGLTAHGTRLAALLTAITDIDALGLSTAHGLALTEAFYWDMNDGTRAFSKRFAPQAGGRMPGMIHAGDYSATLHYLKAVHAVGVDRAKASGRAVVDAMKAMPTEDPLFGPGSIRVDGRKLNPMYLFQVKSPEESKYPWDYYKLLRTIPADQAFRPLADGGCSLVRT
jgi:branched-chain amino acid transport system substrate-binding protein